MLRLNATNRVAAIVCCTMLGGAACLAQSVPVGEDPYLNRKVEYEAHWQRKIERLLQHIDGVVVVVNVEMTTVLEERVTAEEHGDPVTISQEKSEFTRSTEPEGDSTGAEEARVEDRRESTIPRTTTVTTFVGLVPEEVSASIVVPRKHLSAVRNADGVSEQDAWKSVRVQIDDSIDVILPRQRDSEASTSRVRVSFVP